MAWNGENRTHTGAGMAPMGRIFGMAVWGVNLAAPMAERERRRIERALRHRRLICLRKQSDIAAARRFAAALGDGEAACGFLAAPANLEDRASVAFIDRDLESRVGAPRPEFIYRHAWREGDVLIWSPRLALFA